MTIGDDIDAFDSSCVSGVGPARGVPCGHAGCLSHVSHPCEGCGRVAGQPRDPAPGLAEAERSLRKNKCGLRAELNHLTHEDCKSIADEMDRLRSDRDRWRESAACMARAEHDRTIERDAAMSEASRLRALVKKLGGEP